MRLEGFPKRGKLRKPRETETGEELTVRSFLTLMRKRRRRRQKRNQLLLLNPNPKPRPRRALLLLSLLLGEVDPEVPPESLQEEAEGLMRMEATPEAEKAETIARTETTMIKKGKTNEMSAMFLIHLYIIYYSTLILCK